MTATPSRTTTTQELQGASGSGEPVGSQGRPTPRTPPPSRTQNASFSPVSLQAGRQPRRDSRTRTGVTPARDNRDDVATRAARVKHACRIEDVIARYGVALTPSGGRHRLVGLCPFHAEEHASFTVYPE